MARQHTATSLLYRASCCWRTTIDNNDGARGAAYSHRERDDDCNGKEVRYLGGMQRTGTERDKD